MPFDVVERRVGERAFSIWLLFHDHQFGRGKTRVTQKTICRRLRQQFAIEMTEVQVQRQCLKLRKYGLLEDLGWTREVLPAGKDYIGSFEVYYRIPVGVLPRKNETHVQLPPATAALLTAPDRRGGSRKGAGRPRKASLEGRVQEPLDLQQQNQNAGSESLLDLTSLGSRRKKVRTPRFDSRKAQPALPGVTSEPKAPEGPALQVVHSAPDFTRLPASVQDVPRGSTAIVGGLGKVPAATGLRVAHGLPPFPGAEIVNMPCVPPPARLPADAPDEEVARLLVKAYLQVCKRRNPGRWRIMASLSDAKRGSEEFDGLVEAGKALQAAGITPIAWAVFSVHSWMSVVGEVHGKRRVPPLGWVWSKVRIAKGTNQDWCIDGFSQRGYRGRAITTPAHRELIDRYYRMLGHINKGADILLAVGTELPPETFDRLVLKAKSEGDVLRAKYKAALERGDWIW